MSGAELVWAPPFADVDNGLFNEPVVMFDPSFLDAISRWQSEHGHKLKGIWSVQRPDGAYNCAGELVILNDPDNGLHRIWRLTGELDERGGHIAVWPD